MAKATDFESFPYLRDPACGIPFDVHFEIEDEEGTTLGMVGGHKTIMALKSPVFKAMLFGPLAEGDSIKIKNTSMFAFKRMLAYMHDAERDWRPWSVDIRDLFLIADLAERYNLPGLKEETIRLAKAYIFPKERLMEIARLAEAFHVFAELSEAVLGRCASFLRAWLETAQDHNDFLQEWSGKNAEEAGAAFRLLARVDQAQMTYAYERGDLQEMISHLRSIKHSVQPRHRLQQLKDLFEDPDLREGNIIGEDIDDHGSNIVLIDSLKICQMKDKDKAALEGTPLTLDTLVEDGFTHKRSVKLHLDIISLIARTEFPIGEAVTRGGLVETIAGRVVLNKEQIDLIWKTMFEDEETIGIPWAQSYTLTWFRINSRFIDNAGQHHLAEKLRSCDDAVKALPEYNDVCDEYNVHG